MSNLDALAGIILGAFLLTVSVRGNSAAMIELAKRDKDFLKWAIALGILVYLYSVPELKSSMGMLIFIAFVGFALISLDPLTKNATAFWNSLSSEKKS